MKAKMKKPTLIVDLTRNMSSPKNRAPAPMMKADMSQAIIMRMDPITNGVHFFGVYGLGLLLTIKLIQKAISSKIR